MFKKILKVLLILIAAVILAAAGLIGYLTVTEYRPGAVEYLTVDAGQQQKTVKKGDLLGVLTFNTGYGALGRDEDFFMDGGKSVRPKNREEVTGNVNAILTALRNPVPGQKADILLLQEVDVNSTRSWGINEADEYYHDLKMNRAFAKNYSCAYVPYPLPPIGRVESGLCTLTDLNVTEAVRESLPVPFSWPVSVANLKRCMLIERVPVEDSNQELVIINVHLEAYDDGEGKIAQTKQLMDVISMEYRKGNYVIVGGDFNQSFEDALGVWPEQEGDLWRPGTLLNADLPKGFRYLFDASVPTCRSLDKPYSGDRTTTQFYVIDGFIISDNLKVNHIETVDLNFQNSDHNPVFLQVTLQ